MSVENSGLSAEKPAEIDFTAVRQYHQAREAKRRTQREEERLVWLARSREAIRRFAPDFPALERVYLFGSVTRPCQFRPDSDIDVAIESDSIEVESAFWRALEQALQRDVDVRPYIGAIIDAVTWYGEKVYERESHHSDQ